MGPVLLGLAVILNAIANGVFKYATMIQEFSARKIMLLAFGLFIGFVNTLAYVKALEKIDLGVAFPLWSAASIILIAAISFYFFKEQMSVRQLAGLATLCVGMALLWKSP
jgi:multidrug transporter EmrE-like cation transporter